MQMQESNDALHSTQELLDDLARERRALERKLRKSGVLHEAPANATVDTSHPNSRAARRRAARGR